MRRPQSTPPAVVERGDPWAHWTDLACLARYVDDDEEHRCRLSRGHDGEHHCWCTRYWTSGAGA